MKKSEAFEMAIAAVIDNQGYTVETKVEILTEMYEELRGVKYAENMAESKKEGAGE